MGIERILEKARKLVSGLAKYTLLPIAVTMIVSAGPNYYSPSFFKPTLAQEMTQYTWTGTGFKVKVLKGKEYWQEKFRIPSIEEVPLFIPPKKDINWQEHFYFPFKSDSQLTSEREKESILEYET